MSINRNNYETYFIDYLDGKLSPDLVSELLLFLDENPDLKEELSDLDTVPLIAGGNIQYPDKQRLKRDPILSVGPINELNYQEYLIGSVEGDLSVTESRLLERFVLRNTQVAGEWEQFKRTVLVADPAVVFPEKSRLKKHTLWSSYKKPLYYLSGAAAALLVVLLVMQPFHKNEPVLVEQIPDTPGPMTDTAQHSVRQPEVTYAASVSSEPPSVPQVPIKPTDETRETENRADIPISSIPTIHKGVRYQLVSTSVKPARQLISDERNLYSQALPYLTASDKYTLSPSQGTRSKPYGTFSELAMGKVKEIFSGKSPSKKRLPDINLWTLADIGVAGINQLTDSELHIQRIRNEEGRVISYALINEKRELARTRTKDFPQSQ